MSFVYENQMSQIRMATRPTSAPKTTGSLRLAESLIWLVPQEVVRLAFKNVAKLLKGPEFNPIEVAFPESRRSTGRHV